MVLILDGRKVQEKIAERLREKIAGFSTRPAFAIIQIGVRKESNAYIARKISFGKSIGAVVRHLQLLESVSESEIISSVRALNADTIAHGIILQLPLPPSFNKQKLIDAIAPEKDIDGLTTANVNARKAGREDAVTPATARGVVELLEFYRIQIRGKKVAVLGRSALVGTPTAEALRQRGAQVTACHSQTTNTKEVTRASDIIVVAIGKPKFIGADYFRDDKTQTVVDVGITSVSGIKLQEEVGLDRSSGSVGRTNLKKFVLGDVDFDAVKDMLAAISPVPGGVGPMTVAALFENLASAYESQHYQ